MNYIFQHFKFKSYYDNINRLLIYLLILIYFGCNNRIEDSDKKNNKENKILSSYLETNKMNFKILKCGSVSPFYYLSERAKKIEHIIRSNYFEFEYIDTNDFAGKKRIQLLKLQNDSLRQLITKSDSLFDFYTLSAEVLNIKKENRENWIVILDKKLKIFKIINDLGTGKYEIVKDSINKEIN